jgi:uncharacterized NAD(P)/FAD-binding protein YdhS
MRKRVAIIGSGPTAIFALQDLVKCSASVDIAIFERTDVAGKGTPYQRGINDLAMLSNIPSIEVPALPVMLHDWLALQSDEYLNEIGVARSEITDRAFYPRIVVGDYFRSQFDAIIDASRASRHTVDVFENASVDDVQPVGDQFKLCLSPETAAQRRCSITSSLRQDIAFRPNLRRRPASLRRHGPRPHCRASRAARSEFWGLR